MSIHGTMICCNLLNMPITGCRTKLHGCGYSKVFVVFVLRLNFTVRVRNYTTVLITQGTSGLLRKVTASHNMPKHWLNSF